MSENISKLIDVIISHQKNALENYFKNTKERKTAHQLKLDILSCLHSLSSKQKIEIDRLIEQISEEPEIIFLR